MIFEIQEDELYTLEKIVGQLNLIAGLMLCVGQSDFYPPIKTSDMHAYLDALAQSIERVRTDIVDRQIVQRALVASIINPQTKKKG